KFSGYNSHPCRLKPSFDQWMLCTWPHAGLSAALTFVTCCQAPIAPAHTSGGCSSDERTRAEVFPSVDMEIEVFQLPALTCSGPCHSVSIFSVAGSTVAKPLSPSTSSPKRIFCPPGAQVSQLAEAFISAVRLRASPPSPGITKISPPVEPSSLISPEINATDLPSGDQTGDATWSVGL